MLRIEKQRALRVIKAGSRANRDDQAPKNRCYLLGIDREIEIASIAFGANGFTRAHFQQHVGVDRDRVGFDRSGSRDRRRNDLPLSTERGDARLDQALAVLVEVQDAREKDQQRGKIQDDDASRQRREDDLIQNAREATRWTASRRRCRLGDRMLRHIRVVVIRGTEQGWHETHEPAATRQGDLGTRSRRPLICPVLDRHHRFGRAFLPRWEPITEPNW